MEVDSNANQGQSSNVLFDPMAHLDKMEEQEVAATNTTTSVASASTTTKGAGVGMTESEVTELQVHRIRCRLCGVMTEANSANTCVTCLKQKCDITEGISKDLILQHCRECNRYMKPGWVSADLESAELLAICLKHIKGLKRVKLINAEFIWTEPHSRRIKVKLTV